MFPWRRTLTLCWLLCVGAADLVAQSELAAVGRPVLGVPYSLALSSPAEPLTAYLGGLSFALEPGITVDQRVISLAFDGLLLYSLGSPPELAAFSGSLDSAGAAGMSILLPVDPSLDRLRFHAAAVTLYAQASSGVGTITNSLTREFRTTAASYDFSAVSGLLQQFSQGWTIGNDGLAFILVKDGEIVYENAFGSIGLTDRVAIASASKLVSGVAIMTLVRDGLLSLDDRVATFVPSFTGLKSQITIRHCFSHTSGLPANNLAYSNTNLTLAQSTEVAASGPLLAPPGAEFRYGGVSMSVAARVAEVVTGQSFGQLFNQRVRDVLDMPGFAYDAFGVTQNPQVAGAGKCRASDYARLLASLLDGGAGILPTSLVLEMFRDQTNGAVIVSSPQDPSIRYGIGAWRDVVDPAGQAEVVSSPGAFGAWPLINIERGYAGFLLIQRTTQDGRAVIEQLAPLVNSILDS